MDIASFPITLLIIAVNCIVSFLAFKNTEVLNKLIFHPPAIAHNREWYRFITSAFIHKDMQHLLFNMLTLYFFGRELEPLFEGIGLPAYTYLLFYLLAIVVAEIPTYIKHRYDERYYSLGASGAVSAVMFSLLLLAPWSIITLNFIIPIPFIVFAFGYLAYSAYMDRKGTDNIGHSAHLWGAVFGIVFMLLAYPESIHIFLRQIGHPHFR